MPSTFQMDCAVRHFNIDIWKIKNSKWAFQQIWDLFERYFKTMTMYRVMLCYLMMTYSTVEPKAISVAHLPIYPTFTCSVKCATWNILFFSRFQNKSEISQAYLQLNIDKTNISVALSDIWVQVCHLKYFAVPLKYCIFTNLGT